MFKHVIRNHNTSLALLTALALPILGCRKSEQLESSATHPAVATNPTLPALVKTNSSTAVGEKQKLSEREMVKEDLTTIEMLLKVAEKRPAVGSFVELEAGGIKRQVLIDRKEALSDLVSLGIETASQAYKLIPDEQKIVDSYTQRLIKLRKDLASIQDTK